MFDKITKYLHYISTGQKKPTYRGLMKAVVTVFSSKNLYKSCHIQN